VSKLTEDIKADTVFMRWVRTAATTITAFAAAVAVIWSGTVYVFGPRVTTWAEGMIDEATSDVRAGVERTMQEIDRLESVVTQFETQFADSVSRIEGVVAGSTAPSWRFSLPDTSISDGAIGGTVRVTAGGFKLRECGIPRVDLYFVNGSGIFHRFETVSLLSEDNRGVAFPVDPDRLQQVSYTARIPDDDGVTPGRARGFIAVTYPDNCPNVQEVVAGPLQFRITGEG
jgi:hypothetical protein